MADVGEKAYAAGLFDGEGCVQLYMRKGGVTSGRKDHSMRCALSVSSTYLDVLSWLQGRFGGSIKIDQRQSYGVRKPIGRWVVYAKQAEVFAFDICPYLIIKKQQVELWLQAREIMYERGHRFPEDAGLPQEEVDARWEMVYQMKELKHRG